MFRPFGCEIKVRKQVDEISLLHSVNADILHYRYAKYYAKKQEEQRGRGGGEGAREVVGGVARGEEAPGGEVGGEEEEDQARLPDVVLD